jgi:hypothetical protein
LPLHAAWAGIDVHVIFTQRLTALISSAPGPHLLALRCALLFTCNQFIGPLLPELEKKLARLKKYSPTGETGGGGGAGASAPPPAALR